MYKAKAATVIYLDGERYGIGDEILIPAAQMPVLSHFVEGLEKVEQKQKASDKPKKASSKGKKPKG